MKDIICLRRTNLPAQSALLGEDDFLRLTGLDPERLAELLHLDWLDQTTTETTVLFSNRDVYRARKLERICCDFELPVVGGMIIVDLLDRIDVLEQKIRRIQGRNY